MCLLMCVRIDVINLPVAAMYASQVFGILFFERALVRVHECIVSRCQSADFMHTPNMLGIFFIMVIYSVGLAQNQNSVFFPLGFCDPIERCDPFGHWYEKKGYNGKRRRNKKDSS